VGDAGMDAAGEVLGESGGDAPPRGERHGWAGAGQRGVAAAAHSWRRAGGA
jgi:hypothetical protein